MPIRKPLSPMGGWHEVSLYRTYADLAEQHLFAGHYFEAIVVSSVGYDVLVNTLPDRIKLHHFDKLTPEQQEVMREIDEGTPLTAGQILGKLKKANILHWRLDRALKQFNKERNKVIHPIERKARTTTDGSTSYVLSLKPGAVVPGKAPRKDAERFLRHFSHIIDLSGGESPRKAEKLKRVYPSISEQLMQVTEQKRIRRPNE